MVLTTEQATRLIKSIWRSELEYKETVDLAEELQALPSRTPEQEITLTHYLNKIQHDRDVIQIWVQKIKAAGISNLKTQANLIIRTQIMDELKSMIQEEIERLDTQWNDFVVEYGARNPEDQNQEEYDNSYAKYIKRKTRLQKQATILDNLKLSTTVFTV